MGRFSDFGREILEGSDEPVGRVHVVNCAAFLANWICTYGSTCRTFGMSNIDASWVYPTLITPAGWAFGIWGAIFGLQGCFTAMQLLPQYRAKPLLVNGIACYFSVACTCQAVWAIVFSRHMMIWSLVMTTGILVALVMLLRSMERYRAQTISDYVILKAPFHLHFAWIFVVVVLNVNMIIVQRGADNSTIQVVHAVGSFVVLAVGASVAALRAYGWIPAVVSWTFWSIAWNLSHPKPQLEALIGSVVLGRFVFAAVVLATMSSLSAAVLATQGFQDIRDSVLLAPTLDFAPDLTTGLHGNVVLPGAGTRTVCANGHEPTLRDNPSVVTRWLTELPPMRQCETTDDEDDGPRCEQNTAGKGR
jgi:hypothetical protein